MVANNNLLRILGALGLSLLVFAAALASPGRSASASGQPLQSVIAIDVGNSHVCAVVSPDGLKCWGGNGGGPWGGGPLGNGTMDPQPLPDDVVGLTSGVASVSAGGIHTCAVTTTGAAQCWGGNTEGQVGDGTIVSRTTPVAVTGLGSGVAAVESAWPFGSRSCAITTGGAVLCWGLGYGLTPTAVTGLSSGVAAIGLGSFFSCVLMADGSVQCWGVNYYGQLGDGTTTDRSTPAAVPALGNDVTQIAVGLGFACALTSGGAVLCWGASDSGQLGIGAIDFVSHPNPAQVNGLSSGVTAIAASVNHACALMSGGGVKCWGNNADGATGNGIDDGPSPASPIDVVGLSSGVTAISLGSQLSCALMSDATVKCWGGNLVGQLGNGSRNYGSLVPYDVASKPPPDSDGDGCPDPDEQSTMNGALSRGGFRDYTNPYDYFNPTHDGNIYVDDILMVVQAYYKDDDDANPGLPPYEPGYNPDTDRTLLGPSAWNLGPPNGLQRVDDILNVLNQYWDECPWG